MADNNHLRSLHSIAAAYEERLAGNPDYQALQAVRAAIAAIEQANSNSTSHQRKPRERRGGDGQSRNDVCRAIIEKAGVPVPTPVLLAELKERGVEVGGKDPAINLASGLSRSDEFQSVAFMGGRGWWLAGKSVPDENSELNQMVVGLGGYLP